MEKEVALVDLLLEKTRRRRIVWEPTAKEGEFVSALAGQVSFTASSWGSTEAVVMRDDVGRVLLRVESDSVPQVSDLYAEARRVALHVDESLDHVLNQLRAMDP